MIFKRQKRIRVNLVGGLGNQLFGLAFGAAIATKLQRKLTLDYSLINFGSNSSRVLELKNFDFSFLEINFQRTNITKLSYILKNSFVKRIISALILRTQGGIKEEQIKDNYQFSDGSNFSGYFQDWKYADSLVKEGIDFKIEIASMNKVLNSYVNEMTKQNPILVHIRLGDYLKYSNVYEVLPENYYLTAISKMKVTENKSPVWLIVEETKQVELIYPNLFSSADKVIDKFSNLEDYECFYLMTIAKNLVASNSTFSLWASWFALNQRANVIVPSEFIVSGLPSQIIDGRWDSIDLKTFKLVQRKDLETICNNNYSRFNSHFLKL